ncbi:MAG: transglycosylase domain-containing protein [Bacilli bacterium]|nr:transglycosylase domain-containing protein [Bacilli bacterium]
MNTLLKFIKYLFVLTVLTMIFVVGVFLYYARKLNYIIPKTINIEVYDANGTKFMTLNNEKIRSYIPLSEIDRDIVNAFISIEDKKFYSHRGIDILRIGGALLSNIEANTIRQGASTITQQYARNLYLTFSKSYKRKIEEIMIAINLESKYSKDEILEGYLNSIYFDHGIYGIEDACQFYFNKSAHNIELAEAAVLASIPKGPAHYSPLKNPDKNKERCLLVLAEMYKDGIISDEDWEKASNQEILFYGQLDRLKDEFAPYYQDIILNELKQKGYTKNQKNLKIYTALDLSLNKIIIDALAKYPPADAEMQYSIYALNPNTGAVLACIGGRDYLDSEFNRATTALRQPGSTIKPFLYYAALNFGFTPATTFTSTKTNFYVNGKVYAPTNFAEIYPNREVSMAYALAVSDNIYAVKTHLFLGTEVMVDTLKDYGFTTPINDNISLALGTSEVKLSELVCAYSKIASLGKDVKPQYIMKIINEEGKVLYRAKSDFKQKFNPTDCYILSETMTNVFDNRLSINISTTGAPIAHKLTKKYAAKSGTTDFDSWIIGYNKTVSLGIWTGYDDNRLIDNAKVKYIKFLWAEIVERYNAKKNDTWYQLPKDVIPIVLNPITGTVAHQNEYKKALYFRVDNLPWYIFS